MTASMSSRRSFLRTAGVLSGSALLFRHPPGGLLEAYGHMLTTIRDRVQLAKKAGKTLADVQAAKPSAEFDEAWGTGRMAPNDFLAIVYNTVRP